MLITRLFRAGLTFALRFREPYKTHWILNYELRRRPRNTQGSTRLGKWLVSYQDGTSLASMWSLQFLKRYNDFHPFRADPVILDCGANIGVSVLRYKQLFPQSHVIAFEPDPDLCKLLKKNMEQNELHDVEVICAGIWKEDGVMNFRRHVMGDSQAGHLAAKGDNSEDDGSITISTDVVWLGKYLDQQVDFLKLDIEGAELEVLESCRDLLKNVNQVMVECHHKVDQPAKMARLIDIFASADFKLAVYQFQLEPDYTKPYSGSPNIAGDQFPVLWAWKL